jgi:hypothetical protein
VQTNQFTAHVTPRDGIARRLSLQAATLEEARRTALARAMALFPHQPIRFSVRPA